MNRSRLLALVIPPAIALVAVIGVVIYASLEGGDPGGDFTDDVLPVPGTDTEPVPGTQSRPRATPVSSGVTVATPTSTPEPEPGGASPAPTATREPDATAATPVPTATLVVPGSSSTDASTAATPEPTPTITSGPNPPPPAPTPTATMTPTPVPTRVPTTERTPAPNVTPAPSATPLPGLGVSQPGLDPGYCLHCWIYVNEPEAHVLVAAWDTELYLREHFSAATPRVGVCDTCPVVFSRERLREHNSDRDYVLDARDVSLGDGITTLVWVFSPTALRVLQELVADREQSITDGLLVPIRPDHNIRDVVRMLVYPTQTLPQHAFGSLAVTNAGYEFLKTVRREPVPPSPWESLPSAGDVPGCSHCWRYNARSVDVDAPEIAAIESSLRRNFTGSGGRTGCDECPWVMQGPDDMWHLFNLGASRNPYTRMIAGDTVLRVHSVHEMAKYFFGPNPRAAGYVTPVGGDYSAEQVGGMLAWPRDPEPPTEPGDLALTNRGLEHLGQHLEELHTPLLRPYGLVPRDVLPIRYCVSVPADTSADIADRFTDTADAGAAVWNAALGITVFSVSGPCSHDAEVEQGDLLGNGSNDIVLSAFDLRWEHGDAVGLGPRIGHQEFDVNIEQSYFVSHNDTQVIHAMAHELGHHLGFDHTHRQSSVMSIAAHGADTIQPWEVALLRTWWGLD